MTEVEGKTHGEWAGFSESMGFEEGTAGNIPRGWGGDPEAEIAVDSQIFRSGEHSVRLHGTGSPTFVEKTIPIDFSGTRIELRGYLRTEDVAGFSRLWVRQDSDQPLALANSRPLNGTSGWTQAAVSARILPGAKNLVFGVLLYGNGKVWADDFQLLVDDRPVWEAQPREVPKTAGVLSGTIDREFDGGSGIEVASLSRAQIQNLVTLGKVWGFLKYHHPAVTSGKYQWDFELFRILPAILRARSRSEANAILGEWIAKLGNITPCVQCAVVRRTDLQLPPPVQWLNDRNTLGRVLSEELRFVYGNRSPDQQYYVSVAENVGNPRFDRELSYAGLHQPDAGFRLLALYRFWNIVTYWYPYRNLMREDWDRVLETFLPRIALARDFAAYERELLALVARIHDSHANLYNALIGEMRPPQGPCQIPASARFVDGKAVISLPGTISATADGLEDGDVVEAVDRAAPRSLMRIWAPYYPESNDASQQRDMMETLFRGSCGPSVVRVSRNGHALDVPVSRVVSPMGRMYHDLPGEAFQLLSKRVAYLKLSSVSAEQVVQYVERAQSTEGLIVDARNYPSAFVAVSLGSLLVDKETEFARFSLADLSNPGAFHWAPQAVTLTPKEPHYNGKVVILVDEITQSQGEFTAMAFRAAPKALVIGSSTAGADGNISTFELPGGLRTIITGIGVFYPDRRPTQRIGIVPDIIIKPTFAAVRSRRDLVLERALSEILKLPADDPQLTQLYKR